MLTRRVIAANPAVSVGLARRVAAIVGRWASASAESAASAGGDGSVRELRRPARVLDIGGGSLESPRAILGWMRRRGVSAEVTAVVPPGSRARSGEQERGLRLVAADASQLMDHFEANTFDAVHAGFYLHRLPDIEVMTVLRIMDRLSLGGCAWSDVARSPVRKLMGRLRILTGSPAVLAHAGATNAAAFSRSEAMDLARRTGWARVRYRRSGIGGFLLTSHTRHQS